MSLILLSALGEPFTARDLAGRLLPGATLDFFLAGTSEPADVGGDDGHFEADVAGVFEQIDLETGMSYRVVHKTAEGVLLYDVDPYVCTCGVDERVFRSPIQRALDGDGRIVPGARLLSLDAGDLSPLPLYADPLLERPLSNPVVANAAGIFVSPMYADDAAEYVLELQDAAGNTLQDFDPYVCACGGPVPIPEIDSLSPPSVVEDTGAFTLTVTGSNFIPTSVVRWEGSDRTTTYVSSTELEAAILAGDVDDAGLFDVTVFNPGGVESNAEPFEVEAITFATWDAATHNSDIVLSGGNLVATRGAGGSGTARSVRATIGKSAGKWQWELTFNAPSSNGRLFGVANTALSQTSFPGLSNTSLGYQAQPAGSPLGWFDSAFGVLAVNAAVGDVITITMDCDDPTSAQVAIYVNGVVAWNQGLINAGKPYFPAMGLFFNTDQITANFGATPLAFPQSGFNEGVYT